MRVQRYRFLLKPPNFCKRKSNIFFNTRISVHPVSIVFVGIPAENLPASVRTFKHKRRMVDTIEHIGFYGCIMNHILENDLVTNSERSLKTPIPHVIPAKAAVTAQPVHIIHASHIRIEGNAFRTTDSRLIGHLQTIRHMAVVINGALEYAERTGLIITNPNRHTILPKKKKFDAKVLTEEEVRRIIELGTQEEIYPLVVLCMTCGLRKGEALSLKWHELSLEERKLKIIGNLCRIGQEEDENGKRHSVYEILEPKTKSSIRTIYLPEVAYQALLLQKQRQEQDKEKYADIYLDNDFVFARPDGRHLNPRQMMEHFHKFLEKYGITDVRFHDLRHTAATMMLESGISIKIVQDILGHSNLSTTADIYSHISENAKEKAMKQLEAVYGRNDVAESEGK